MLCWHATKTGEFRALTRVLFETMARDAWWPLLVGCVGLGIWYLHAVASPLPAQPAPPPVAAGAAAVTLALLLLSMADRGSRAAPTPSR